MRDTERLDSILEQYLDLALRGRAPDLESFLGAQGDLDDSSRERLRARARAFAGNNAAGPDRGTARDGGPARERNELPFERLGEFRLIRRLGAGGMGVVFLAEQESLGREVALKVVRPELAGTEEAERRFARESAAVASLRHPNIVAVYSAGEDRGVRYLAMEHVPGESLDEKLRGVAAKGARLAPAEAVRWALEIARALECAHASGVIHRDVKPSNVRIDSDGRARLLDFGLARLESASTLSATGSFHGTPYFASPEQVESRAREVDSRTDVYSLGATLYQCVTGAPPFEGVTSAAVFHAILTHEPVSPRRVEPRISRDLETVIQKAMEKDRERRYGSAGDMASDLEALLEMRPIRARRPGPFGRAARWSRREPALAGALALAVLTVAGASVALPVHAAMSKRADARAALARATDLARRADELWDSVPELRSEIEAAEEAAAPGAPEDEPAKQAVFSARATLERALKEREELLGSADREYATALSIAPLAEVEQGLAEFLARQYVVAESEGDERACTRLASRLRGTAREDVLRPRGRLTLDTEPSGAAVEALRYVRSASGRLVEDGEHALFLGMTPLESVELDGGSWLLLIDAGGETETRYPLQIERDREWRAQDGRRIPLLSAEEIGSLDLVYVPAGWAWIGPDRANPRRWERRLEWVEGFLIARHEVTAAEYREFLDASTDLDEALAHAPRRLDGRAVWQRDDAGAWRIAVAPELEPEDAERIPVGWVSSLDARAYAEWLARETDLPVRVPSEVEWERAARGADGREFPWGNEFEPAFCASPEAITVRFGQDMRGRVAPVESFESDTSPFGVRDLAGSVSEWVDAGYDESPDGISEYHVFRGGSAGHTSDHVFRAGTRMAMDPSFTSENIGFRIACDLPAE